MDLDYVIYDTAVFGTVANFENVLFQVSQGSDATHTENFTNARGAGTFPQEESFLVKHIGVVADFNTATPEDYQLMWYASFLELRVSDKTLLKAPLHWFAHRNAYQGHYSQAAAADNALIGLMGDGYMLENPISIKGGTSFRVRVVQGTALSAVSKNVKVNMRGLLSIPN